MEVGYKVLSAPFSVADQEKLLNSMLESGYEFVSMTDANPNRGNWIFRRIAVITSIVEQIKPAALIPAKPKPNMPPMRFNTK